MEGNVSGGERTSAVLTLRLALAVVLAPSLRLMLLDEPTHNLDVRAIEELASTLRDKVSNVIEQTFIITHEEKLEDAVTGRLYRLDRGETKEGITEVHEV